MSKRKKLHQLIDTFDDNLIEKLIVLIRGILGEVI